MADYYAHEKAIVESRNIGSGSRIWAFAHILPKAKIGRNANICDFCFIENDVEIGDNVTVKSGVYLWDGIKIEDGVFIGPNACFTNDLHPRSGNRNYEQKKTLLKEGCSIGANATILADLTIGKHSLIGAGSVVTVDVPSYALVFGNPAIIKGYVCSCGATMQFRDRTYDCPCGRTYTDENNTVTEII